MIPLKCPVPLKRFPVGELLFVLCFFGVNVFFRHFKSADFTEFLASHAFLPSDFSKTWYKGLFFSSNYFNLFLNSWFIWIFLPAVRQFYSLWRIVAVLLSASFAAMFLYSKIHLNLRVPVHSVELWVAAMLGLYMRYDVWGELETLVVGPGWLKVYAVPCYVLLFFFFFYLLCANLLLDKIFSDAPMLYFLPFFAFIWGFLTGSSHLGDKHLT